MTNPLNISLLTLPGPLPEAPLIRAAEVKRRADHAAALDALHHAAQARADALQHEAEARLQQAQREAEALLATAQQEAQALRRQAYDKAINEAVQWLCCEQDMEQLIARELTRRWRTLTAQVLEELLGQYDQNELLLRRVERKVAELLPRGSLTLSVAPSALASATRTWAETPEVCIRADASLLAGEAWLDNGLVRIHLDTPAHQASLLAQLAGTPLGVRHG